MPTASSSNADNTARRTILLLEDDRWFAGSLARTLTALLPQFNVITTVDPATALTMLDQYQPVLLIADLHLGGRNFLTLLNELASYPDTLKLPKIILSSSGDQLHQSDLAGYGVAAVMDKKTYDIAKLVSTIKRLVGNND